MIKDESVLSRWSRRKQQSEQQTQQEDVQIELRQQNDALESLDQEQDDLTDSQQAAVEQQPVLTDADMPDIDSLHENSDFSSFMSPGVSDQLRNLALKKLFHAPSFNICDGLDEYDEDYTKFEKLGDIITCDMKHQLEMEAEKKLREEEELSIAEVSAAEEQVEDPQETEPRQELSGKDQPVAGGLVEDENSALNKIVENTAETNSDNLKSQ